MKINPRIYDYANEENKIESQELGEHNLEIYYMKEGDGIKEDFVDTKGKFAVWSSQDGKNYRLYIEEGYHNKLKQLYCKKVNGIWLDFWDECEKITKKFRLIVLPITLAALVAIFLCSYLLSSKASMITTIAIAGTFLIFLLAFRKLSNKKFADANKKSVDEIKKYLGENTFNRLLDDQRSYMDEYFKYDDETTDDVEVFEDNETSKDLEEVEVVSETNKDEVEEKEENKEENNKEE